VSTFIELLDVFITSYSGKAGQTVVVNDTETGVITELKGWFYNIARTFKVIFNIENLTADRTVAWQNKAGTVALLENETSLQFQFNSDTANSDPGSGKWKIDAAETNLYINALALNNAADFRNVLETLKTDSIIYIQDSLDFNKFYVIKVTADASEEGTYYYKVPITVRDNGDSFEADDIAGFTFLNAGNVTRQRLSPTIASTVLNIDFAGKNDYKTLAEVAVTANFSITLSNVTKADIATIDLRVTNTVIVTLPANSMMQDDDDRWTKTPTYQLEIAGGTGNSFELSLNKVGTKYKWVLSQIFE